jgi:hypothetical protein
VTLPVTFPNFGCAVVASCNFPSAAAGSAYVLHTDFASASAIDLRKRLVTAGSVIASSDGIPVGWIAIGF